MTNIYFSSNGITSTEGNYLCNIAKESQEAATERLNGVKFFNTSVAVIGSNEKQLMSEGNSDLEFIKQDLETLASMNAFCAWIREAIKEKDSQIAFINAMNIEVWAKENGINIPVAPVCPTDPCLISEKAVIDAWDANKRNRYLCLEAYAAAFGKYIHPKGTYSEARKEAHVALNNPITKEGAGRDMVLYYTEPSVSIDTVDSLFMALQEQHRSYEKELNQMKAEIKETVNDLTRQAFDQHQIALDNWKKECRTFNADWTELRSKFSKWRTNELERISNLKITIPEALKPVFKMLKEVGDTSK